MASKHARTGLSDAQHKKAALGLHKKYPAGHQTPKQLAAERANLARARQAKVAARGDKSYTVAAITARIEAERKRHSSYIWYTYTFSYGWTPADLAMLKGTFAARRANSYNTLSAGHHPMGTHFITANLHAHETVAMPTGTFKRFKKRIAPTSFGVRGGWRNSRHHAPTKKRLHVRKLRSKRVKKWRRRDHSLRPR